MIKNVIMLEFGGSLEDMMGHVQLNVRADVLPLNEYVLAPSSLWIEETQKFEIQGWGLVHRSHIHPEYASAMAEREEMAKQ